VDRPAARGLLSTRTGRDLPAAGLAVAGAAAHLVALVLLDRWPPGLRPANWFETLPPALALVGAATLVVRGDRRRWPWPA
jgi:hypothetical protein